MKKLLLDSLFAKIRHGGLKVAYWDGEEINYGDVLPQVTLIFKKEPPLGLDTSDSILALGEAYMDGIIDYEGSLEEMLRIIETNRELVAVTSPAVTLLHAATGALSKLQQKQNIQHHYDLGNDFFALWLDKTMSYSCAYFQNQTDSLYQAQLQKIDHILKKILLKPGERLLDIGCGWGWLIIKAAQQYGVRALGITLSEEQYLSTQERISQLGLTDQVEVQLSNYLDLDEAQQRFDKIVSVGMFEHVGRVNLPNYMEKVSNLLVPGGTSLLHTITATTEDSPSNSWIKKYIFPGGYIPTLRETIWLLADYDLHLLQAESLRLHYAMTLDRWFENFSKHLDTVRNKFGQRFVRMWSLYLCGCAASFRASGLDIHQLLFSKGLNNELPLTFKQVYE